MRLSEAHFQAILLAANRKTIGQYFDLSSGLKQFWYRSESLFRYLIYNFYGFKPIGLPSKYENKLNRLRIHNKTDQRTQFKALNHVRNVNQLNKTLPRRFPYFDRLVSSNANAPLYLKKWRRTFKSDLNNFALITLAVHNSTSEEEIQWTKLSSLIKQLYNEENKNEQLDNKLKGELFKLENFLFDRYIGKGELNKNS